VSEANVQHALATDTVTIAWDAVTATPITKVTASAFLKFAVRRTSDGEWYDFTNLEFRPKGSVATLQQALTAVDATDAPGLFAYDWDLTDIDNANDEDTYQIIFEDTNSPKDVGFEPRMEIVVGSWSRQSAIDALYDGAIWIDAINGTDAAVPLVDGTRANPCKTPANAKTLADALGYRHYKILSSGTGVTALVFSAAAHTEWTFEGVSGGSFIYPIVEIDGINAANSLFKNVGLQGDLSSTAGVIRQDGGMLLNVTGVVLYSANGVIFQGSIDLAASGQILAYGCKSSDIAVPSIGSSSTITSGVVLQEFTGEIDIDDLDTGATVVARFISGKLTIGSSSVAGTVTYSGNVVVDEQSTPGDVTIDNEAAFDPRHVTGLSVRTQAIATGSASTIPVANLGPTGTYDDMRVICEDAGGSAVEERGISTYVLAGGFGLITVSRDFSFLPAAGDPVTIRLQPKEVSAENIVIDNQTYAIDGTGKLMTSARKRIFRTAAEATAATKGGTDEGEIATMTITAEVGANPNEPSLYKEVKS
jgi:hypothetical protein